MNRQEWKAFYSAARKASQTGRYGTRKPVLRMLRHAGEMWSLRVHGERYLGGPVHEFRLSPAFITSQPVRKRAADALEWSRYYRGTTRAYRKARGAYEAARACIADARAIRLSASPFALLP